MKHISPLRTALTVLCLGALLTGISFADDHGNHSHGPSHGFHGRFFGHGPRFFFGGPGPLFWGPAIGFSYYGAPGYYGPAYGPNDGGPDGAYRGVPVRGNVSDDLGTDVQRALAHEGYYHGAIDGEIGPGSRAAIRAYQNDRGLEVNGHIDSVLLRSLHID